MAARAAVTARTAYRRDQDTRSSHTTEEEITTMCRIVVPASTAAWPNVETAHVAIAIACVIAAAWVLRVIAICVTFAVTFRRNPAEKKSSSGAGITGADLTSALDAVRPAREIRWLTRGKPDRVADRQGKPKASGRRKKKNRK
jgi:hypothetical protein